MLSILFLTFPSIISEFVSFLPSVFLSTWSSLGAICLLTLPLLNHNHKQKSHYSAFPPLTLHLSPPCDPPQPANNSSPSRTTPSFNSSAQKNPRLSHYVKFKVLSLAQGPPSPYQVSTSSHTLYFSQAELLGVTLS